MAAAGGAGEPLQRGHHATPRAGRDRRACCGRGWRRRTSTSSACPAHGSWRGGAHRAGDGALRCAGRGGRRDPRRDAAFRLRRGGGGARAGGSGGGVRHAHRVWGADVRHAGAGRGESWRIARQQGRRCGARRARDGRPACAPRCDAGAAAATIRARTMALVDESRRRALSPRPGRTRRSSRAKTAPRVETRARARALQALYAWDVRQARGERARARRASPTTSGMISRRPGRRAASRGSACGAWSRSDAGPTRSRAGGCDDELAARAAGGDRAIGAAARRRRAGREE